MARKKVRGRVRGSLERKPSGIYLARITVNGQRITKSTGTADIKDAKLFLKDFVKPFVADDEIDKLRAIEAKISDIKEASEALKQQQNSVSINGIYDAVFSNCNAPQVSEKTKETYRVVLGAFSRWMEKYPTKQDMLSIDRDIAEEFLTDVLDKSQSAKKYSHYLVYLKKCWAILAPTAHLVENPWDGFKYKREAVAKHKELTTEEMTRLFAVLANEEPEMRAIFNIAKFTGLRLVDCCHLKMCSIDLCNGVISVVPQKTKKHHPEPVVISIHAELMTVLKTFDFSALSQDDFLFPVMAHLYDSQQIHGKIRTIFKKAGISTVDENGITVKGFHSLRVTFASRLGRSGEVSLPVLQSILGHKTLDMSLHYVREDEAVNRKAIEALSYDSAVVKDTVSISLPKELVEKISAKGMTVEDFIKKALSAD